MFSSLYPHILLALAFGYLLGSIPFGMVLTKLTGGPDLRAVGSGNIGATNVLRSGGKALAAATLLGDMLKGTVAVLIAHDHHGHVADERRFEIAGVRDLRLESDEAPRRAAENTLLLALIDVLVLVDPVRHAREPFGGPGARGAGGGRSEFLQSRRARGSPP